jgi:glycosyltransferase involved in cell wall biosynthesis
MKYKDKILILTPVKDAVGFLDGYFKSLYKLIYPHSLISLGFLESDSKDNTYCKLEERLPELKRNFRSVELWKKDFGFQIPSGIPRWSGHIQIKRRTALTKSRNHLLFHALDDEDWVLWLDVDVVEYPPDIIEKLLETGKDIVQPNCVKQYGGISHDLNAWRDKGKLHLHDLREEGDLVKLHSVGGTMLLIKGDIHRDGLIFPPFLYGNKNPLIRNNNFFFCKKREILFSRELPSFLKRKYVGEIETEGLGVMAYDMGCECWGMPNLEIRHRDS